MIGKVCEKVCHFVNWCSKPWFWGSWLFWHVFGLFSSDALLCVNTLCDATLCIDMSFYVFPTSFWSTFTFAVGMIKNMCTKAVLLISHNRKTNMKTEYFCLIWSFCLQLQKTKRKEDESSLKTELDLFPVLANLFHKLSFLTEKPCMGERYCI